MDADVEYDAKFRREAVAQRRLGIVLLAGAVLLWFWACVLLLIRPAPSLYGDCDPPGLAERYLHTDDCDYGAGLGLPVLLLAIALPPAVIGGMLAAAASTRISMSEHRSAMQGLAHSQSLEVGEGTDDGPRPILGPRWTGRGTRSPGGSVPGPGSAEPRGAEPDPGEAEPGETGRESAGPVLGPRRPEPWSEKD